MPLTAEERYVADLRAQIARGDVEAEVALGNLYEAGDVLPQDPSRRREWYRRAADKGHAGAQMNLAMMYFDGEGVPARHCAGGRVVREGRRTRRSDRQLQPWLDLRIGADRVRQDEAKAATWYRKAAGQGWAPRNIAWR